MSRRLFIFATGGFWMGVLVFWLFGRDGGPLPAAVQPNAQPTMQALAPPAERLWSLAEVAAHAVPEDCWMAIDGQVYDLSAYLPEHPSRPAIILPWCGREASDAYRTKGKGRPHSAEADQLLATYRVGRLQP